MVAIGHCLRKRRLRSEDLLLQTRRIARRCNGRRSRLQRLVQRKQQQPAIHGEIPHQHARWHREAKLTRLRFEPASCALMRRT